MRRLAVVAILLFLGAACGSSPKATTSSGNLPRLPAASQARDTASASGTAAMAPEPGGATTVVPSPAIAVRPVRDVTYRAAADLPTLDGTAPAYRLKTTVDKTAVERLARALGIDGEATAAEPSGWTVGTDDRRLTAYSGGGAGWSLTTAAGMVGTAGSAVASSTACAPPPDCAKGEMCAQVCTPPEPPPTTVPPPPPSDLPAKNDARQIALKVAAAAGMEGDGAVVDINGPDANGWTVIINRPKIGGVAVLGLEYYFVIGSKGAVTAATGSFLSVDKIGDYPLAGTSVGIDRLNAGRVIWGGVPRPLMALAPDQSAPSGPTSSLPPEEVEVTGAKIVLSVQVGGGCPGDPAYLVPAYELTWADGGQAAVPAVTDAHLEQAEAGSTRTDKTGVCPGQTEPVPTPGPAEPPQSVKAPEPAGVSGGGPGR